MYFLFVFTNSGKGNVGTVEDTSSKKRGRKENIVELKKHALSPLHDETDLPHIQKNGADIENQECRSIVRNKGFLERERGLKGEKELHSTPLLTKEMA